MKIYYLILAFILISSINLIGQSSFGKELTIGNSLTYISNEDNDLDFTQSEITYAKNVAVSLNDRFDVGLNWLTIWSRNTRLENSKSTHNIVGVFAQYKLLDKTNFTLGPEMGIYIGNYCTCGNAMPYKLDNLIYYNWGVFSELKITNNFYLDLGFNASLITNDVSGKYGYTQYVVGVNYKFFAE